MLAQVEAVREVALAAWVVDLSMPACARPVRLALLRGGECRTAVADVVDVVEVQAQPGGGEQVRAAQSAVASEVFGGVAILGCLRGIGSQWRCGSACTCGVWGTSAGALRARGRKGTRVAFAAPDFLGRGMWNKVCDFSLEDS